MEFIAINEKSVSILHEKNVFYLCCANSKHSQRTHYWMSMPTGNWPILQSNSVGIPRKPQTGMQKYKEPQTFINSHTKGAANLRMRNW